MPIEKCDAWKEKRKKNNMLFDENEQKTLCICMKSQTSTNIDEQSCRL